MIHPQVRKFQQTPGTYPRPSTTHLWSGNPFEYLYFFGLPTRYISKVLALWIFGWWIQQIQQSSEVAAIPTFNINLDLPPVPWVKFVTMDGRKLLACWRWFQVVMANICWLNSRFVRKGRGKLPRINPSRLGVRAAVYMFFRNTSMVLTENFSKICFQSWGLFTWSIKVPVLCHWQSQGQSLCEDHLLFFCSFFF